MSPGINHAQATARQRFGILIVTAALAVSGCGETPATESTSVETSASPATSAATDPPATTSSPPTTSATTTTVTTTTAAATTTEAPSDPIVLAVPAGPAPVIDGQLSPDEWAEAATMPMSDGASLLVQYMNGTLYVAVAGDDVGSVNVIIGTESEVQILHSSAALGSARYVPGTSGWSLDHGFSWCCRRGSTDSARATLFAEEGWEANIGYAGDPGIVEYAIAIPWAEATMAVSSLRSDDDMGFFPADLSAEARSQLVGVPPSERVFSTDEWVRLQPGSG